MKTSRMMVLMLLVMMVTSMSIATSAYASGFGAAEDFAYYLWEYYGWQSAFSVGLVLLAKLLVILPNRSVRPLESP